MDSDNATPIPNDILETKEKISLLYFALNKKVKLRTKRTCDWIHEGILKKIQGDYLLLEKEDKKKIEYIIISIADISSISFVSLK